MKVTYITAGAGGMYCGSCIRDNSLAQSLMDAGHDVLLLPMYTPTRTDEENVSSDRIFYGGISVYLEQHLSAFRRTPWLLDRLWESPWLLRAVAGRAVQTDPEDLGDLAISVMEGRSGHQSKEIDKLLHWLESQPKPDIIDISNSMLIALAQPLKEALKVPVCCTLQGEDVFLSHLSEKHLNQSRDLIAEHGRYVDRFLAVSDYCATRMNRFLGVPGAKIDVVPLGVNVDVYSRRVQTANKIFTIGHFGRIAPEKGLHLLCEAYRRLRESGKIEIGSIEIAGYLSPGHEKYLNSVLDKVKEWGLGSEVNYHGQLDKAQKVSFLHGLDAIVIPSVYDDPKGLPLLEAMSCGVPAIVPRRGSYTEFLERTGGGILVPPDDGDALVEAIHRLSSDPQHRLELGQQGADGIRTHYTNASMAERATEVYSRLIRQ